jgi:pectate lyase
VLSVRIIVGIGVLAISFYTTMLLMDWEADKFGPNRGDTTSSTPCAGPRTILTRPFGTEKGFAVTADLPQFRDVADANEFPSFSTIIICEEKKQLGPAHSAHDDIRTKGMGRYSHWNGSVIFSASDNSDPQTNMREYTVRSGR